MTTKTSLGTMAMGKGRLRVEFVERAEVFSDRCVAVAEQLESDRRFARVIDQLVGSGTSVGANTTEADQAMSVKDFRKSLAIVMKELNETRFWLRLCVRRQWLAPDRLASLMDELEQLRKIVGSLLARTADKDARKKPA